MTSKTYISIAKITALTSFLIGMLISGAYYFTTNGALLFVGYAFVILAGIVNLIVLAGLWSKARTDTTNRGVLWKAARLMLLNIPVLFICIWIATIVLGNMRITFTNGTENKLTDIRIIGCETAHIAELEPRESKTVWVEITADCSISVEYLENGAQKSETVAGYVTSGMGQKIRHNIDGRDKDIR